MQRSIEGVAGLRNNAGYRLSSPIFAAAKSSPMEVMQY